MSAEELGTWREQGALPAPMLDTLSTLAGLKAKRAEGSRKVAGHQAHIEATFNNQYVNRLEPAAHAACAAARNAVNSHAISPASAHPGSPTAAPNGRERLRENIKSLEKVGKNALTDRYLTDLDKEEDGLIQTRRAIAALEEDDAAIVAKIGAIKLSLASEVCTWVCMPMGMYAHGYCTDLTI